MTNNFYYVFDVITDLEGGEGESDQGFNAEILEEINKNLEQLNQNFTEIRTQQEEQEQEQEQEEQEQEEQSSTASGLVVNDTSADTHLYLSSEVENATINDLYSIALSTRNIVLLFCLIFLFMRLFGALKNVIYRIMDKRS